jgi:excinuclease UvrABC helicase subunit UvrB
LPRRFIGVTTYLVAYCGRAAGSFQEQAINRKTQMNYQAELNKVSQTVQKQIAETEDKISEVQNEFAKTIEVMNRAVMSSATANVELGVKLSQKLTTARSPLDALSAYQEWLTEAMQARTEDTRQFAAHCQNLLSEGTRMFSNGRSKKRMSR